MKYSYPVPTLPIMPGIPGLIGHGWAWMEFQGVIAMAEFHPDKHGGSEAATTATRYLLELKSGRAGAS